MRALFHESHSKECARWEERPAMVSCCPWPPESVLVLDVPGRPRPPQRLGEVTQLVCPPGPGADQLPNSGRRSVAGLATPQLCTMVIRLIILSLGVGAKERMMLNALILLRTTCSHKHNLPISRHLVDLIIASGGPSGPSGAPRWLLPERPLLSQSNSSHLCTEYTVPVEFSVVL